MSLRRLLSWLLRRRTRRRVRSAAAARTAQRRAASASPGPLGRPPRSRVVGVLVGIDGDLKGQVFGLFDGENRLGRSPESDVVLASGWISRNHASLVYCGGVFHLQSLSQQSPTLLNDKPVEGAELKDRDIVGLGPCHFCFRSVN